MLGNRWRMSSKDERLQGQTCHWQLFIVSDTVTVFVNVTQSHSMYNSHP